MTAECSPVARVEEDLKDLIPEFMRCRRQDVRELQSVMASGRMDRVRFIAHNLRGTGAAYGFDRISEIGLELGVAASSGDLRAAGELVQELSRYLDQVRVTYVPAY